jgi:hypothetical protein
MSSTKRKMGIKVSDIDFLSEIVALIPSSMTFDAINSGDYDFTDELDEMVSAVQNIALENDLEDSEAAALLAAQFAEKDDAGDLKPPALLLRELVQIITERLTQF